MADFSTMLGINAIFPGGVPGWPQVGRRHRPTGEGISTYPTISLAGGAPDIAEKRLYDLA